jgi:hypothetical protein
MQTGKTSAATLGLVGGVVLGAWIGSELTTSRANAPEPPAVTTEAVQESPAAAAPAKPKRVTRVNRVARAAASAVGAPTPESTPRLVMTIPVSAPELHARMKPVLARGTKMPLAVDGFTSAEQFATIAHAARNTQVPFILLKHRVLVEGQSLEEAITASKPDIDARSEVQRARQEAKADMAALSTTTEAAIADDDR